MYLLNSSNLCSEADWQSTPFSVGSIDENGVGLGSPAG